MRIALGGKLRRSMLVCAGIMALGLGACDDDNSDPAPVALDELQAPRGLTITDLGSGTVRLMWSGSNNEDDFDGYNVYGAKDPDVDLKEGQSLKLLDEEGEPDAGAKAVLQKMAYNGSDLDKVGTKTDPEKEFEYYPISKSSGETVYTPTCQPSETTGEPECKMVESEEPAKQTFNGRTYFDYEGLTVGTKYCFLVLSSMDAGTKVSQASSEFRCVTPRAVAKTSDGKFAHAKADNGTGNALDLAALRANDDCKAGSCTITGSDPVKAADDSAQEFCNKETKQGLCIENFGTPEVMNFTTGKNTVMQDLGYYADGFSDMTLPNIPMISVLDNTNELQNGKGYSLPGQSLAVLANHMYVVAEPANDDATSFYYHLIYVSETDGSSTVTFEVRVAVTADQK